MFVAVNRNDQEESCVPKKKKARELTDIAWIELLGSVHATESLEKVSQAIYNLVPPDIGEINIQENKVQGHYGNPVMFLTVRIEKRGPIRKLLTHLANTLSLPDKQQLGWEFPERIDTDNIFYLKVDKQKAYQGESVLTHGDNTILIKMKFRQYVKNSEQIAEKLLALGLIAA